MNPNTTFPPLSYSLAQFRFEGPGGVSSSGKKSAGFWIFSGWGVPFVRVHRFPVTNTFSIKTFLFLTPKVSSVWYGTVSIRFFTISGGPSYICFYFLTRYLAVGMKLYRSSSGLVRIGMYRPSRSEVSYTFGVGVPISSGISSSSS